MDNDNGNDNGSGNSNKSFKQKYLPIFCPYN